MPTAEESAGILPLFLCSMVAQCGWRRRRKGGGGIRHANECRCLSSSHCSDVPLFLRLPFPPPILASFPPVALSRKKPERAS